MLTHAMWFEPNNKDIQIGQRYNDYIITDVHLVDGQVVFTAECIVCGHILNIPVTIYNNPLSYGTFYHSFKHCQETYLIYENSSIFNDYEYIPGSFYKTRGSRGNVINYCKARCTKCGHIKTVNINSRESYELKHSPLVCGIDYHSDLVGKIIDDYTIISADTRNIHGQFTITLKCNICGHIISNIPISSLAHHFKFNHSFQRCQEDYLTSIKMKGDYKFHRLLDITKSKKRMCEIKCTKCGHIKQVYCDHLELCEYKHWGMNCGEDYYKEEIGNIYDDLKIIDYEMVSVVDKKTGWVHRTPMYIAKCLKCGITKKISLSNLQKAHGTKHDDFEHIISQYIPNRSDTIYRGFYDRWRGMHDRCYNSTNNHYKNYGGRGIKVCDRWKDNFVNFFYDMWESYKSHVQQYSLSNTTIDRIDNDSDYTPNNTRWATNEEQSNNTRRNVHFRVYDEKTKKLIGEYIGLNKYLKENNMGENDRSNVRTRLNRIVNQDTYKGRIYEKIYD